jgi:hypothetical protein
LVEVVVWAVEDQFTERVEGSVLWSEGRVSGEMVVGVEAVGGGAIIGVEIAF